MKKSLLILIFLSQTVSAGYLGILGNFIGSYWPCFWLAGNVFLSLKKSPPIREKTPCADEKLVEHVKKTTKEPSISVESFDCHIFENMYTTRDAISIPSIYMDTIKGILHASKKNPHQENLLKRFNALIQHEAGHFKHKDVQKRHIYDQALNIGNIFAFLLIKRLLPDKIITPLMTFGGLYLIKKLAYAYLIKAQEYAADDHIQDIESLKAFKEVLQEKDISAHFSRLGTFCHRLFGDHPVFQDRVKAIDKKIQRLQGES